MIFELLLMMAFIHPAGTSSAPANRSAYPAVVGNSRIAALIGFRYLQYHGSVKKTAPRDFSPSTQYSRSDKF